MVIVFSLHLINFKDDERRAKLISMADNAYEEA
jgi:hypothetical protein